ncbi:prolyl oligopeptidase family serine peptidase [Nocardiopsis aegyptia]|uniref:S9 family peptidase n=1 Tax=Nocardiopsis aegyptia TaxID=220378 RepID=UPI00366B92C2
MSELSNPQPITAGDVARGVRRMAFPSVVGDEVWWEEERPDERRVTLMRRDADGTVRELLPAPWGVGTRVHEYGGRSFLPVPRRDDKAIPRLGVVFAHAADQRLYLWERDAREPVPLTPEPHAEAGLRYADFALSADGRAVLCVREEHGPADTRAAGGTGGGPGAVAATGTEAPAGEQVTDASVDAAAGNGAVGNGLSAAPTVDATGTADTAATADGAGGAGPAAAAPAERHRSRSGRGGDLRRSVVAVPLSGRGAQDPPAIRELASGADFYASPTESPDGGHLAYVRWNHPRMPWDGTELRVVPNEGAEYTLKGGVDESVLSPLWVDDSTLYLASDWPGWWNLYQAGLKGQAIALYPAEEEFHAPPWRLGHRSFQVLSSGLVVALHGLADMTPSLYDPETLDLTPIATDLTSWSQLDSDGTSVVAIAASPTTPPCLVRLDPATGSVEVLRTSDLPGVGPSGAAGTAEGAAPVRIPVPQAQTLPGRYGAPVHVNVYPPEGSGPAPFVVHVHGGPVSHSTKEYDLVKAFFTSRGIGVADVNYGGSTGYGRSYRKRLHKEWGVVDVEDAIGVARSLVDQGLADPDRLAIRGPSAGGLTALLSLTTDTFACGVSYYGVADLLGLAETTHDFESRFLDSLVGTLPGFTERYRERSPINRIDEIDVPVLLLQGTADPVVTPDQARSMATALGERGVPHALVEFEGEGHGFRSAQARIRALDTELAFYARVFGTDFGTGVQPLTLSTTPPDRPDAAAPDPVPATAPEEDGTPDAGGTREHEHQTG